MTTKSLNICMVSRCAEHDEPYGIFCNQEGCRKAICVECLKSHKDHVLLTKKTEVGVLIKESMDKMTKEIQDKKSESKGTALNGLTPDQITARISSVKATMKKLESSVLLTLEDISKRVVSLLEAKKGSNGDIEKIGKLIGIKEAQLKELQERLTKAKDFQDFLNVLIAMPKFEEFSKEINVTKTHKSRSSNEPKEIRDLQEIVETLAAAETTIQGIRVYEDKKESSTMQYIVSTESEIGYDISPKQEIAKKELLSVHEAEALKMLEALNGKPEYVGTKKAFEEICIQKAARYSAWKCYIGDNGASVIATALKSNTNLVSLELDCCSIGEIGGKALGNMLSFNKTIKVLHLQGFQYGMTGQNADKTWNHIGQPGMEAIAESLKTNTTLEELYVSRNMIAPEGIKALVEAVKRNSIIRKLDITQNTNDDKIDLTVLRKDLYVENGSPSW